MTKIDDQAIDWKLYAGSEVSDAAVAGNFAEICGFRITLQTRDDEGWTIDSERYTDRWRPVSTDGLHRWTRLAIVSPSRPSESWNEQPVERELACRIISYLARQVGSIVNTRLAAVVAEAIATEQSL